MVLRFAEREKKRKSLTRRNYSTSLFSANLHDGESSHVISFSPGLTVISGGNGAGKSSVLGTIWQCLAGLDALSPRLPHWLVKAEIRGSHGDADWARSYNVVNATFDGNCPVPVEYIDASSETERLLVLIGQDDNPGDLTEGIDPSIFDDGQVELLSYVLRREYDEVRVYEVTAFSENDEPAPFFEVTSMGKAYDLRAMGRGELSAAYLIWRLGNIEPGSIVLIEEPESHLAAFSQHALTDAIISILVDRDLTLVLSTHSPGVIKSLPSGSIVLLNSSPVPSVRSNLETIEVARHLGLQPACDALLIAEDIVAEGLLKELLRILAPDLASRIATRFVKNGESGVVKIVEELSTTIGPDRFVVLGILDGDQKARKIEDKVREFGYLMDSVSPDELLRNAAFEWRSGRIEHWSPSFSDSPDQFRMALEELDGLDHHDWVTELAKRFGGYSRILRDLTKLCLKISSNAIEADHLVGWIRAKLL